MTSVNQLNAHLPSGFWRSPAIAALSVRALPQPYIKCFRLFPLVLDAVN